MEEPLLCNDTDFEENEDNFFTNLRYRGQPFTGTLVHDNLTAEFRDGNANGRVVEYHENGQVATDYVYENGEGLMGWEWDDNGQLRSETTAAGTSLWDADGILAHKNGSWFYKSGAVKQAAVDGGSKYYSSSGELAITVRYVNDGDYKSVVKYDNDVLLASYPELLLNLYPGLDQLFYNTEWYVWGWFWQLAAKNKQQAKAILHELAQHPNQSVRATAAAIVAHNTLATANERGSGMSFHIVE
ncbi:MAG: hypothetical protein M3Y12_00780 [Bacteroidota bacterium]|nr:hypothetical protein [Bacteroidota bacterium]